MKKSGSVSAIPVWFITFTLGMIYFPFTRLLIEGHSYTWSIGSMSGSGIYGQSWMILIAGTTLILHQYLGFNLQHKLVKLLTTLLTFFLVILSIIFILDETTFGGATAQVEIKLGWLIVPSIVCFGIMLRDLFYAKPIRPFSKKIFNKKLLAIALALFFFRKFYCLILAVSMIGMILLLY